MTTTETGIGIHKAIVALKLAIARGGGITKDSKAPMGYAFRGIEQMDNILCGLTAEHGIAIYPRILSKDIRHGQTDKGKYQSHVTLEIEWTFVSTLDGSKQIVSTVGEAMDTQDKAMNKAMQASRKYALILTLMIPTAGDDTEIYVPEPAAPKAEEPTKTETPREEPIEKGQEIPPPPKTPGPIAGPIPRGAASNYPTKRELEPAKPRGGKAKNREKFDGAEDDAPFPNGATHDTHANGSGGPSLIDRIRGVKTFPLLYAFAQDAETSTQGEEKEEVFQAIRQRAIELFDSADSMKGVQEGFELVTALGQPDDLKRAANKAYAKHRT